MEDSRIATHTAEWNPQGKSRYSRLVKTWKDEIKDSKQGKSLKDEECFDQGFWRKKNVPGLRKTVYSGKKSIQ
jgi:hypothetical protein